jgi:hypothetical protein
VWSAREWLNLTLAALRPHPAVRPTDVLGGEYGELTLAPSEYRIVASARLFY